MCCGYSSYCRSEILDSSLSDVRGRALTEWIMRSWRRWGGSFSVYCDYRTQQMWPQFNVCLPAVRQYGKFTFSSYVTVQAEPEHQEAGAWGGYSFCLCFVGKCLVRQNAKWNCRVKLWLNKSRGKFDPHLVISLAKHNQPWLWTLWLCFIHLLTDLKKHDFLLNQSNASV